MYCFGALHGRVLTYMNMIDYTCDNWPVIKMKGDDPHLSSHKSTHKPLRWRIVMYNSGITKASRRGRSILPLYGLLVGLDIVVVTYISGVH
jgi:hypothetical protein